VVVLGSFDLSFVSTNWLLCLFINTLPWDCVFHVVDILLFDGPEILLRAALAVLLLMAPRILAAKSQVPRQHACLLYSRSYRGLL
jgi:hypothetical protein